MRNVFIAVVAAILLWQVPAPAQSGRPTTVAELAAYNKSDREQVLYKEQKRKAS